MSSDFLSFRRSAKLRSVLLPFVVSVALVASACGSDDEKGGEENNNPGPGPGVSAACAAPDLERDRLNCGTAGNACAVGQVCVDSACVCRTGLTDCSGACVDTLANAQHCGACGTTCAQGEVCDFGECVPAEPESGETVCNGGLVELDEDASHCGGCGNECQTGQICREGVCTYGVVAACLSTGHVVGFRHDGREVGPRACAGTAPQTVLRVDETLVAADAMDAKLYELNANDLTSYPRSVATGASPNHMLAFESNLFVVNSLANTLTVYTGASNGALVSGPAGLGLTLVGEFNFGDNTSPQAMARIGNRLYVPLYGGAGAQAAAGGSVVELDIANPASPTVTRTFDLKALNLSPFSGQTAIPRPYSITVDRSTLYVALNTLNDAYEPAGPGHLVRISPSESEDAVQAISLGDTCLNAGDALRIGEDLVAVSCIGRFAAADGQSRGAGVVMVDTQTASVASRWSADCPTGATNCQPASPAKLATLENGLFVADSASGRVFVLDSVTLEEFQGFTTGAPLGVCPAGDAFTTVSGLATVPFL